MVDPPGWTAANDAHPTSQSEQRGDDVPHGLLLFRGDASDALDHQAGPQGRTDSLLTAETTCADLHCRTAASAEAPPGTPRRYGGTDPLSTRFCLTFHIRTKAERWNPRLMQFTTCLRALYKLRGSAATSVARLGCRDDSPNRTSALAGWWPLTLTRWPSSRALMRSWPHWTMCY